MAATPQNSLFWMAEIAYDEQINKVKTRCGRNVHFKELTKCYYSSSNQSTSMAASEGIHWTMNLIGNVHKNIFLKICLINSNQILFWCSLVVLMAIPEKVVRWGL